MTKVSLGMATSPLASPPRSSKTTDGLCQTTSTRFFTHHCARAVVAKALAPPEPAVDLVSMLCGVLADEVQLESATMHMFPIEGSDSAGRVHTLLLAAVTPLLVDAEEVRRIHRRHLGTN